MSTEDLTARIAAARARLASLRPAVVAGAPWPLAERFDHAPEASWGPPEVLAHVAEMLPYWLGEVERIVGDPTGSVPFGRIGTDALRIGIIERDRALPVSELFERIEIGLDRWTARVADPDGGRMDPAWIPPDEGRHVDRGDRRPHAPVAYRRTR